MKKVSIIAVGLALGLLAFAPTASAIGMLIDPDGVRAVGESDAGFDFWAWLGSIFGDAGPHGDPDG